LPSGAVRRIAPLRNGECWENTYSAAGLHTNKSSEVKATSDLFRLARCRHGRCSAPVPARGSLASVSGDGLVSAGHISWRSMAVLGGRAGENPQDFREVLGVQVPPLRTRSYRRFLTPGSGHAPPLICLVAAGWPLTPAYPNGALPRISDRSSSIPKATGRA